ncbi:MAG: hypothetical protein OEY52_17080 [Gammaproteobacteria bacterium]|nr:hypothetical protein [Gammaproteobacteria bacterium]
MSNEQIRFVRLFDSNGRRFIDTPEKQSEFLEHESEHWEQEDVYMTQAQFDKLEEYQGL